MKEKKNIDQLFRERFAEHEVTPPAQVWENIQAQLREEKKERVLIPLWWKVAGVAASLILIFSLSNTLLDDTNKEIVEEVPVLQKEEVSPEIQKDVEINNHENAIHVANRSGTENTKSVVSTETHLQNKPPRPSAKRDKNRAVAAVKDHGSRKTGSASEKNKEDAKALLSPDEGIATTVGANKKSAISVPSLKIKEAIIVPPTTKNAVVAKNTPQKTSIFDAIDEQKEIEATDAVANSEKQKGLWEIAPNIAPVYYNTLGEGSSIDQSFADNAQRGDINISYGVGVRYALSNRLKIRSGINNVALSYRTGGIELGDGPVSAALKNIDYDRSGIVVIAQDLGTFSSQTADGTFGEVTPKSTNGEAFINQNISYYEIPLELSYAVVNKKLGIEIIGGISTLLLGNNDVSVTAGSYNEALGSANNLSDLSFATNIGLGVHYKLSNSFKVNVEPMFKYQLNPYTDSAVDFKPYYVGVYTGLSFKF
jgi:hypothetical protein